MVRPLVWLAALALALPAAGIAGLDLAAPEPAPFKTVDLQGDSRSYIEVVGERQPTDMRDLAVHGALQAYDLTDLARSLGDRLTWTGRRSSSAPRSP